jgi:hypothetical protein
MILSCRFFKSVVGVNDFSFGGSYVEFSQGNSEAVYFQLIDASKDKAVDGFNPPGRRVAPTSGATLSVVIENIDDAKKITRSATQPFAQDPSIWKLQIYNTDNLKGTYTLRLTLTEGAVITKGKCQAALRVETSQGL